MWRRSPSGGRRKPGVLLQCRNVWAAVWGKQRGLPGPRTRLLCGRFNAWQNLQLSDQGSQQGRGERTFKSDYSAHRATLFHSSKWFFRLCWINMLEYLIGSNRLFLLFCTHSLDPFLSGARWQLDPGPLSSARRLPLCANPQHVLSLAGK